MDGFGISNKLHSNDSSWILTTAHFYPNNTSMNTYTDNINLTNTVINTSTIYLIYLTYNTIKIIV